jgi:hypothetical protein
MTQTVSKKYIDRLGAAELNKVMSVANSLKIAANWLLQAMEFETADTFSPSKRNPIGSVGLIQFTHDPGDDGHKTIAGKRYSLDDIADMSFVEQMDLVYLYFKPFAGRMRSYMDVYTVIFFPAALGKSNDFVIQTSRLSASLIARQNPAFDKNKDKQITLGEIRQYFASRYGQVFESEIDIPYAGVGGRFAEYVKQYFLPVLVFAIIGLWAYSQFIHPKTV